MKLITGKAVVLTVIVTALEAALAIFPVTGHVFDPRETYVIRLKAVVVDNAEGSKVKEVAPGISVKLPPKVQLCHW